MYYSHNVIFVNNVVLNAVSIKSEPPPPPPPTVGLHSSPLCCIQKTVSLLIHTVVAHTGGHTKSVDRSISMTVVYYLKYIGSERLWQVQGCEVCMLICPAGI